MGLMLNEVTYAVEGQVAQPRRPEQEAAQTRQNLVRQPRGGEVLHAFEKERAGEVSEGGDELDRCLVQISTSQQAITGCL